MASSTTFDLLNRGVTKMRVTRWKRLATSSTIFLILGLCLMTGQVSLLDAQTITARLNGSVVDPSGLVLPSATVVVEDLGTSYTQTTRTDSSGEYLFPSLPVGMYRLTATMTGFSTYTQTGITLAVGQSATVRVPMAVGSTDENVTVNSDASLVTTDSPTVEAVIGQKDIVGLPLNGRLVQQLVFLAPGTTNVTSFYCAANCEGGTFPSEQYAKVNGAGANGVSYQLDGADYNDPYLNINVPFPNPDALQEFSLVTGNMSAAYGNAIGAVVNVVTKSGSNQVHGDVFEFIRNKALDAAGYFGGTPNPLKQNEFGGSIGGPIFKNRFFYFGSYQGTRFRSAVNGQISYVPNEAERTGDFSDLLPGSATCTGTQSCVQLVDPVTGATFLNNQIPVSSVAKYLLDRTPLPNGPNYDEYRYNGGPDSQNTDEYLGKLDFNFNKHRLSGHYFQLNYTAPLYTPPSSNLLLLRGDAEKLTLKSVSVADIFTISSSALLNSYFGYTSIVGGSLSSAPFNMADAGVKMAVPPNHGGGNAASLNISVGSGFGYSSGSYGNFDRSNMSFRELATFVKGRNELQVGAEAVRIRQPMGNLFQEGGTFNFSNLLTGNDAADFVLGRVSSFTQGGGLYLNFTGIRWATFVQDNFKLNSRLILNAGFRWDPYFPYKDSLGRVGCFVPGAQSVRFPNSPNGLIYGGKNHDAGCPESGFTTRAANFSPRLGFAYQVTADGKTSIRGGAGYYYQAPNTLILQQIVGISPFAPVISLTDVSLADPYGSAGATSPFPGQFGPVNPGADAPFPSNISFSQISDKDTKIPVVLSYNLTVERGIGSNWLFRASYVGNTAHHLYGTGDQESGLLQLNPAIYIPGQSTAANTQQRRPFPAFGPIASINFGVNSSYHSGQFTLQKRFARGLSVLANFTWAKGLDDFAPQGAATSTNTCTCGRYFDYGPAEDDLSKIAKFNADYEIPHLRVPRVAGLLFNGWETTAIANWHTGFPFTIFSGVDNSFSGIFDDRADLTVSNIRKAVLSTGRSHADMVKRWFDPSAFTANQIGTFGNTGKNALRGPRFFVLDLAAIKNLKFNDRYSAQFRAEFFNALNNVNFGNPSNSQASVGFGQIGGTFGSGAYGGPTSYGTDQPRIIQFGLKIAF